ncbi:MAG: DUF3095 domain-containing protein [Deltaproteobacteria bacterium]|nr:DUF3095 domain-containing protein [Deltaproteobacteria bacterium]
MSGSESFYAEIPAFTDFVEVTKAEHYRPAPLDWRVVITDVIGSTKAIEAGRYKDVNSLGVASIVALRNALPGIELPFVFGGDGATILVPSSHISTIEATLRGIRRMAQDAFDMDMRTSTVAIEELHGEGHEVLVARYQASDDVYLAMFSGNGLTAAEKRIKDPELASRYRIAEDGPVAADFTGFECRWKPIPSRHGQVASILVQARSSERSVAEQVYREVLQAIAAALQGDGRPVDPSNLQLQGRGGNFDAEAKIRAGKPKGARFVLRRMIAKTEAMIGTTLMRKGWRAGGFPGDIYKGQVVSNTDFRKFDDTLRMVVDVGPDALEAIRTMLAERHARGQLVFGIHVSGASLMTCAIESYEGKHVHFVDGADGGYALAAKQMKQQIKGE